MKKWMANENFELVHHEYTIKLHKNKRNAIKATHFYRNLLIE
jgi:hypothetical protein